MTVVIQIGASLSTDTKSCATCRSWDGVHVIQRGPERRAQCLQMRSPKALDFVAEQETCPEWKEARHGR